MKKLIVGLIILIACFLFLLFFGFEKEENILYSWDMDVLTDNSFLKKLKRHNIKTIYQDFSSDYLNNNGNEFLEKMNENKINVYHLCGDADWIDNKERIIEEIDKVITYNKRVDYKIKGIVFDIEPYHDGFDSFDFKNYVEVMKDTYMYMNSNDLYMVIAIPYWLEKKDKKLLEELIKDGADEISVMNYNINNTLNNIEDEVKFSKKYNKNINTIYEINFSDDNYFSSYDEINSDYIKIKDYYNYKEIKKAYHHYGKMKEGE